MSERYWISDGVNQAGPYPREELPAHGLRAESLVWAEGMADWLRADAVDELRPLLAPEVTPVVAADDGPAYGTTAAPEISQPMPVPAWQAPSQPQPVPTAALAYQSPAMHAPPSQAMAITSFVLGLAGFFVGFIASILAIVFGHIALGRIRRGEEGGRGFAIAGLILGYLLVVLTVGAFLLFGALFCTAATLG